MRRAGIRQYLPEALWLQGKALLALSELDLARDIFLEARRVGQETEARRLLWQILRELSTLEMAAGNAADANLYREQVQAVVAYVANHAGSDEPRVVSILAPGPFCDSWLRA